uniref:CD180 molecule n=1 Tax=Serinus canaria TaxID=9135 RepID=A0A8C9NBQ6_SERCA
AWESLGMREVPMTICHNKSPQFQFQCGPFPPEFNFSDLNSLLCLDITRCQISWVCDGAFPGNRQLKTVIPTRNLLMFLSVTAFAGPHSLEHLNTDRNNKYVLYSNDKSWQLRYLHLGQHPHLLQLPSSFPTRNLKTLNFLMNNIQAITAEDVQAPQKTSNVTLILKGNDITYIEPGSFQSYFYSLDLVGCADIPGALVGIQNSTAQPFWLGIFYGVGKEPYVSSDILQGLCSISVKDLYLHLRHLRNLNADTFQSLTRLQKLNLTQPHIHALPPGISGMSLLEEVVLSANCFEQLCNTSSAAFASLTCLHIKGNSQGLQPGSGYSEKLAKLQYLDLSHRLCYLNLSHNTHLHLQEIEPFPKSPSLASARDGLSSSHINISIQHVFKGLKNLMFLDLSQNNFDLGIMPKDKLFQQLSSSGVLVLPSCKLTSIGNQVFHNLRKLQHVDLNYNKFTAFSTDAFSNLKSINLSCVHYRMHIVPGVQLVPRDGRFIINLSYNLLDCSCSKIDLITYYKQHLDTAEDPEGTRCSEPKLLAGFSWPPSHAPVGRIRQESLQLSWLFYPVVPSSFGVFTISIFLAIEILSIHLSA